MLSSKSLEFIKQQSQGADKTQSPRIISIEVANGFAYGHVIVSSPVEKDLIYQLSNELGWLYRGRDDYSTSCEFKTGSAAIAVGDTIKAELVGKGWEVNLQVEAYR